MYNIYIYIYLCYMNCLLYYFIIFYSCICNIYIYIRSIYVCMFILY